VDFNPEARMIVASRLLNYSWGGSNHPRRLMESDTSLEDLYQASARHNRSGESE
jgi:hypothetical protein